MEESTENIDFSDEEKCREYLETKFNDLLQGINNLYGKELREELLQRLSDTIEIFHRDISSLLQDLKQQREPIASQESPSDQPAAQSNVNQARPVEKSSGQSVPKEGEWERHLKE